MSHTVADVFKFEILDCLYSILSCYEVMKKKVLIITVSYPPTNCYFCNIATYMRKWMLIETGRLGSTLPAVT